jgi:CO/xanthine dehydrogenase FAD-binding subunit
MKPPKFSYAAPETLEECLSLLTQYGDEAKILAGGQSLMPLLNLRMVRPQVIVDIGRVRGLGTWKKDGRSVSIGALVRQRVIEIDKPLTEAIPMLAEVIPLIGHPATRSRGTIVGSMCHADPAAELPLCAVLLGADFLLRSSTGSRVVKANDFFEDALSTATRSDEIVEAIRLPVATTGSAYAFEELTRRHGDFALVSVGAAVETRDGRKDVRVALGGVSERPVCFSYNGNVTDLADQTKIAEFGHHVARQIEPNSDLHATADFRRSVAATLIERTLLAAFARAGTRSQA